MGLTKQYLRYGAAGTFNIIASSQCNCNHTFITYNQQDGRYVAVGAAQHVFIWDMKLAEKVQVLNGDNAAVSCIVFIINTNHLAVGYTDGILKIFDLNSGEIVNNFYGHKNQITAISFDSDGHRIASGAKDNEIIIWDSVDDAGICRLTGHKDQITQILFIHRSKSNILISASKDTFIKFWDLQTNHCFQTLTAHKTEVWNISLLKNEQYLVSGSNDSELRVWQLKLYEENENINNDQQEQQEPLTCHYAGSILRASKGRVVSLKSDSNGQILATHGVDHQIELFMFCDDQQVQHRVKKRLKKQRNNNTSANINENNINDTTVTIDDVITTSRSQQTDEETTVAVATLKDQVRRLKSIKLNEKPKSVDVILGAAQQIRISIVLNKNSIILYSLLNNNSNGSNDEAKCLRHIGGHHGHQSECRSIDFSSDDLAMVSGSADGSIKVWNQRSQQCLRTIYTEHYVLCVRFVPGDRHALVGLKNGHLLIVDISVGDILEDIAAHEQELWSICVTPDLKGCVTGSNDCTIKFWNYQLINDEESLNQTKVLSLLHTKTLKLDESILAIQISSNQQFIAIALLDSTVKIFFIDTLKFYLQLYGHKLPILCLDISYDSNIIVTGSADRNVKIWGLDYGDCHKSIFAHNDSITSIQFMHSTHYFCTSSKDGSIKQWDADSYQLIITLYGHIGQVYSLSISPNGKYILSTGSDFTLRLWERTDEIIVLEDQQQQQQNDIELEQQQLATGDDTIVPGKGQLMLPSKKTIGSEKGAELIMECIQISIDFKQQLQLLKSSTTTTITIPAMMQAFNITDNNVYTFIITVIKSIRSSDLEESLLLLPFTDVCQLLELLTTTNNDNVNNYNCCGDDIEIVIRIITILIKIHSNTIRSSSKLIQILTNLHENLFMAAHNYRDIIAYNMFNLLLLQRELQQIEGVQLFKNATNQFNNNNKNKAARQRQARKQRHRLIIN